MDRTFSRRTVYIERLLTLDYKSDVTVVDWSVYLSTCSVWLMCCLCEMCSKRHSSVLNSLIHVSLFIHRSLRHKLKLRFIFLLSVWANTQRMLYARHAVMQQILTTKFCQDDDLWAYWSGTEFGIQTGKRSWSQTESACIVEGRHHVLLAIVRWRHHMFPPTTGKSFLFSEIPSG